MSSDEPKWIDKVTTAAVESLPKSGLQGVGASSLSLALMSVTPALPDNWELVFQYPLFGVFVLGLAKLSYKIFF